MKEEEEEREKVEEEEGGRGGGGGGGGGPAEEKQNSNIKAARGNRIKGDIRRHSGFEEFFGHTPPSPDNKCHQLLRKLCHMGQLLCPQYNTRINQQQKASTELHTFGDLSIFQKTNNDKIGECS